MSVTPLTSVIMPTYNRAATVGRAIGSVLGQTYRNVEVLVVDDRSTDETPETVRRLCGEDGRVRYVLNAGAKGPGSARNYGLSVAEGDYIAFLDDDDEYAPEKIARHIEPLLVESRLDCVVCGTPCEWISPDGGMSRWWELEFRPYRLFHPSSVMCRRTVFEDVAFRGSYMEWRDLAFQLFERGTHVRLSGDRFFRVCSSPGSLSKRTDAMLGAALENAKAYRERTMGRPEHAVFQKYLANCWKNVGNCRLKQGRLVQAALGYTQAFHADRRIRNLVPFA